MSIDVPNIYFRFNNGFNPTFSIFTTFIQNLQLKVYLPKDVMFQLLMKLGASLEALNGKEKSVLEASLELKSWKILKFLGVKDFAGLNYYEMLDSYMRSDFEDYFSVAVEWISQIIMKQEIKKKKVDEENETKNGEKETESKTSSAKEDVEKLIKLKIINSKIIRSILGLLKRKDASLEDIYRISLSRSLCELVHEGGGAGRQAVQSELVSEVVALIGRFGELETSKPPQEDLQTDENASIPTKCKSARRIFQDRHPPVENYDEAFVSLACEFLGLIKGVGCFNDDALRFNLVPCIVKAISDIYVRFSEL